MAELTVRFDPTKLAQWYATNTGIKNVETSDESIQSILRHFIHLEGGADQEIRFRTSNFRDYVSVTFIVAANAFSPTTTSLIGKISKAF